MSDISNMNIFVKLNFALIFITLASIPADGVPLLYTILASILTNGV